MNLPNLSYLKTVGELRYIQARFEKAGQQNPDSTVGAFLPLTMELGADLSLRLQPDVATMFNEDCLLKLVAQSKKG
jgi:hypothetical protein